MKTYITFGQDHAHEVNGKTLDKDCVAVIEGESAGKNREKAFELFGPKFCFEYPEQHFPFDSMHYYSRGFIQVSNARFGSVRNTGEAER